MAMRLGSACPHRHVGESREDRMKKRRLEANSFARVLVFAVLLTLPLYALSSLAMTGSAAAQEGGNTVNVELILDSSGSMAEVDATGQSRIDAAKQVLNSVIDQLPEREGVNVGFRVYGHQGNNTEAGK